MARKKHKADSARSARKEKILAPFPPEANNAPVWRHFWTLLAAGFALRLLAAFSAEWIYRPDEILQYLEQAHRLVYGTGFLPWEIRFGARNLLVVMPAAGVMALCKSVGAGPGCYIPAVEFFNAALSLAIPASLYFIARRMHGEIAGRAALTLGCLWYSFVVFAPHLLSELMSANLILAGMACVPPRNAAKVGARLFAAALLIGLGGMLRLPYIPVAGLLGILMLIRFPVRCAPFILGGAFAALLVAGGVDWIVWGGFLHSALSYLNLGALTDGFIKLWPDDPARTQWHAPISRLTTCSGGLWLALFILALTDWRRHWPALAMIVVLILIHDASIAVAYSQLFLILPFFALIFGGIAAHPPEFLRGFLRAGGRKLAAGALALLSLAGATHSLPGQSYDFWPEIPQPRFFFHEFPWLQAARFLSRVPPEKMRATVWNAQDPLWTGGYYYFHHPVPQWHEGMKLHRPALAALPLAEMASHYVALSPDGAQRARAAGFQEAAHFGAAVVYENPQWEKIPTQWEHPFPLSLGIDNEEKLEQELKAAGRSMPPPEFLRGQ